MCECVCCLLPIFSVNQRLVGARTEWGAGPSSLAMLVGRHGTLTGNKQWRLRENESKLMHLGSCRRRSFVSVRGEEGLFLFIPPSPSFPLFLHFPLHLSICLVFFMPQFNVHLSIFFSLSFIPRSFSFIFLLLEPSRPSST